MKNLEIIITFVMSVAFFSYSSVKVINYEPPTNIEVVQDTIDFDDLTQYVQLRTEKSMYIFFKGNHVYVDYCPDCGDNGTYQLYHAVEGFEYTDRFEPTIEELEKRLRTINFEYYKSK
jgi:hypothetical protein